MPESERRFVVLSHVTRTGQHWDLMIERGDALATWQLLAEPQMPDRAGARIPVRRISDHRLAYLDYEGPISGDRGYVTRVDAGACWLLSEDADAWELRFAGTILSGTFVLTSSTAGIEASMVRIA